ncbi:MULTISPECIES: hypothetical protein [unclassified Massilia]|uniref:hypothetical protein n=1 Tax=unclassified Massilia TaxID=2609279 RepID=UPI001B83C77E|nr:MULTISPECIES: hypothetical protein [unclassified Massilia]MBQ5941653.1 hypothetical protein [Massilia sp. AB1]MBQ5962554.1 hypothetical protein [Massilia sp. ZL223]
MLTSTYTLVALSVEQARARVEVEALMERWRPNTWWGEGPHQWTLRQFEQACEALRRVYESCHWRKLDRFVLPALRRAGAAAESLLVRLEGLSRRALDARVAAQAKAAAGSPECLRAVEHCCSLLLEKLELEERELFPLARALISGETWFAIANQMLAHDSSQYEARSAAPGLASGAEYSTRQGPTLPLVH